ncbi:hypothetical protein ACFXDJ_30060 [Streptomyces sp. NPDC059443]|uniref:hypothetical protein n=1 Tax=unclassified Streptomyces TaxID=2593676 RepID=UPI003698C970
MSAAGAAPPGAAAPGAGVPRPSGVSMGALLAAGAAASAVSTPPARERGGEPDPAAEAAAGEALVREGAGEGEQAAPESEAA